MTEPRLNLVHKSFSRSSYQLYVFRIEEGRKERKREKDRGGCSLKRMFLVGPTWVFWGLAQGCAGSVHHECARPIWSENDALCIVFQLLQFK